MGNGGLGIEQQHQLTCDSDGGGCGNVSTSNGIGGTSARRPVKLPLRKHHSFHFQPSQTVAGALNNTKNRYKNNGPLIFKPFNEKSAFKPITPVPKSPNGNNGTPSASTTSATAAAATLTSSSTTPRICGTSLKRHISNVETFNHTNRIDETNSMSDDEDSASTTTPPSTSSASTARGGGGGKRLHYADLAAPTTTTITTPHMNKHSVHVGGSSLSGLANGSCNGGSGGSSNSSSSCDQNRKLDNNLQATNGALSIKRTTQYATLKFNEVNI